MELEEDGIDYSYDNAGDEEDDGDDVIECNYYRGAK